MRWSDYFRIGRVHPESGDDVEGEVYRKCVICGVPLEFGQYADQYNDHKIRFNDIDKWNNPLYALPCCSCLDKMRSLKKINDYFDEGHEVDEYGKTREQAIDWCLSYYEDREKVKEILRLFGVI